jgi:hypothetical protein
MLVHVRAKDQSQLAAIQRVLGPMATRVASVALALVPTGSVRAEATHADLRD